MDNRSDDANGFIYRKAWGFGKKIVLKVSRTSSKKRFALSGVVSKHKKRVF